MLVNRSSREKALEYISEAIIRNKILKPEIDPKVDLNFSDGFLLNLLSILQFLSVKIKIEEIDPYYPFHSQSLVHISKDESRIKFTTTEAENWLTEFISEKNINLNVNDFNSQCFVLTLHCHHICLIPYLKKFTHLCRRINELKSDSQTSGKNAEYYQNQMMHKSFLKSSLFDEKLLARCLTFYNQFCGLLLKTINCENHSNIELPLTQKIPELFATFLKWYIEDMTDIFMFLVNYYPQVLSLNNSNYELKSFDNLIAYLNVIINSTHFISDVHLIAKFINLINIVLIKQESFLIFGDHQLTTTHLVPSLIKFFININSPEVYTEMYEKVEICTQMNSIFTNLMNFGVTQNAIFYENQQINEFFDILIINTKYLMEKSLEYIETIYNAQDHFNKQESTIQLYPGLTLTFVDLMRDMTEKFLPAIREVYFIQKIFLFYNYFIFINYILFRNLSHNCLKF